MDIKLTDDQQKFYDCALKGESIFLSGKAGTGKTFVTKLVIQELKERGKNIAVLAPTGVAANNVGGATIHSLFALPVYEVITYDNCKFVKSAKRKIFDSIDVLLIDEVSMVRADMIDGIHLTMKKNGCYGLDFKQVIFIGDMGQLPPVASDNFKSVMLQSYKGVEFYHADIVKSINIKTIELNEVKRQDDPEFISALNVIREGGKSQYFKQFHGKERKGIVLAPHKSTVSKYNIEGLNSIEAKEYTFKAIIDGNIKADDFNFDETVTVKNGCKIMYLVNSKNNNLVNGSIGVFEVDDGDFFIKIGDIRYSLSEVEVTKKEYVYDEIKEELVLKTIGTIKQMPIRLAYALSIHKSQGLTFDEVTIDLSEPCFASGQLYVALSRVRTPQGLSIVTGNRIIKKL